MEGINNFPQTPRFQFGSGLLIEILHRRILYMPKNKRQFQHPLEVSIGTGGVWSTPAAT